MNPERSRGQGVLGDPASFFFFERGLTRGVASRLREGLMLDTVATCRFETRKEVSNEM